jgi:hypothetical protein
MRGKSAKEVAQERYKYITEIYESGITSAAEIFRKTSIPPQTVSRYIAQWKVRTPVDEIKSKGRPPKIRPTDRSYIGSEIANSPFLSSRDLQTRLSEKRGLQVS